MSVSGVTSNTFGSYAKRIGRIYLHSTFGTGADEFMTSMNKSIFDSKAPWYAPYRNADWKNFSTKFKQALEDVEVHEETIRKANGNSYLKAFWHQIRTIPEVFSKERKAGVAAAKAAGTSKFWGGFKGVNKAFMKRMPLIGGLMALGFQIPNLITAFTHKDGGVATGLLETGKVVAKLGLDTAGFMVGQALIPIPFIGGIIGSCVASWLGEKVLGKSFAEQKGESSLPGELPYIAQNTGGQSQDAGGSGWTAPKQTMSDEELVQMAQYMNRGSGLDYSYG